MSDLVWNRDSEIDYYCNRIIHGEQGIFSNESEKNGVLAKLATYNFHIGVVVTGCRPWLVNVLYKKDQITGVGQLKVGVFYRNLDDVYSPVYVKLSYDNDYVVSIKPNETRVYSGTTNELCPLYNFKFIEVSPEWKVV